MSVLSPLPLVDVKRERKQGRDREKCRKARYYKLGEIWKRGKGRRDRRLYSKSSSELRKIWERGREEGKKVCGIKLEEVCKMGRKEKRRDIGVHIIKARMNFVRYGKAEER